jgi:hypothetical protein
MTTDPTARSEGAVDPAWRRYGEALLHAMAEVRAETPEGLHALLMETADYWLSIGLALATGQPEAASRLLELIEAEEPERNELTTDAEHFIVEALG